MTADERALMQAIIAAPNDDLPRLVYADWLEEHGRPERAEFIRIQCRMARLSESDPGRHDLAEQSIRLLSDHYKTWETAARAGLPPNRLTYFTFRRGMLAGVTCTVHYFAENAEAILRVGPIETVRLLRPSLKGLVGLTKVPEFSRVPGVEFNPGDLTIQTLTGFLALPLGHLRSLALSSPGFYLCPPPPSWTNRSEMAVVVIAGADALSGLHRLDLRSAGVGDVGGLALARAGPLSGLRQLDLRWNWLAESTKRKLRKRYGSRVLLSHTDPNGNILSHDPE